MKHRNRYGPAFHLQRHISSVHQPPVVETTNTRGGMISLPAGRRKTHHAFAEDQVHRASTTHHPADKSPPVAYPQPNTDTNPNHSLHTASSSRSFPITNSLHHRRRPYSERESCFEEPATPGSYVVRDGMCPLILVLHRCRAPRGCRFYNCWIPSAGPGCLMAVQASVVRRRTQATSGAAPFAIYQAKTAGS